MGNTRELSRSDAATARQIQAAIDDLAGRGGGRLVLPEMALSLDRGLALRSGVELCGRGASTVLRKGPGRTYPLAGYHNYGMCDVPLVSTSGLEPGMTVSVHDDKGRGFYETFATITWIDGDWVGLDRGIEADYRAGDHPVLTTAYPLVFALDADGVAVRDLTLEGNRAQSEEGMGACRGAAVYFYRSRDIEITGIRERDYDGEGLGFQICRDVLIRDCRFADNSGNGLHPGAGSTNALFEDCEGSGNGNCGFFFCVRANHISVRDCRFTGNGTGVSIGTRDCHNLIDGCTVDGNAAAGVLARPSPRPVEVHSCAVRRCRIEGNAGVKGQGQVEVTSDAHDLIFAGNRVSGRPGAGADKPGFYVEGSARTIYLADNEVKGCAAPVAAAPASLAATAPDIECGYGTAAAVAFRHLPARADAEAQPPTR